AVSAHAAPRRARPALALVTDVGGPSARRRSGGPLAPLRRRDRRRPGRRRAGVPSPLRAVCAKPPRPPRRRARPPPPTAPPAPPRALRLPRAALGARPRAALPRRARPRPPRRLRCALHPAPVVGADRRRRPHFSPHRPRRGLARGRWRLAR